MDSRGDMFTIRFKKLVRESNHIRKIHSWITQSFCKLSLQTRTCTFTSKNLGAYVKIAGHKKAHIVPTF